MKEEFPIATIRAARGVAGLGLGEGLAAGLGEALGLAEALGEGLAAALGEALGLAVGLGEGLGLAVGLGLAAGLGDALGLAVGLGLGAAAGLAARSNATPSTNGPWRSCGGLNVSFSAFGSLSAQLFSSVSMIGVAVTPGTVLISSARATG